MTTTPNALPMLPNFIPMSNQTIFVKQAPRDTVVFDENSVNIAQISELLFEDLGGIELANISRSDLIDGQKVSYSAIANLSTIRQTFNPNNIVSTIKSDYFSRFPIDLLERGIHTPYIDENGDLIIEVDIVLENETMDVEITSNGTINRVDI